MFTHILLSVHRIYTFTCYICFLYALYLFHLCVIFASFTRYIDFFFVFYLLCLCVICVAFRWNECGIQMYYVYLFCDLYFMSVHECNSFDSKACHTMKMMAFLQHCDSFEPRLINEVCHTAKMFAFLDLLVSWLLKPRFLCREAYNPPLQGNSMGDSPLRSCPYEVNFFVSIQNTYPMPTWSEYQ